MLSFGSNSHFPALMEYIASLASNQNFQNQNQISSIFDGFTFTIAFNIEGMFSGNDVIIYY